MFSHCCKHQKGNCQEVLSILSLSQTERWAYSRLFHYFLKLILAQWREAYRILCVSRAQIQNLSKIGPKLKLSGLCPAQLERRQIWQIGSTWLLKIVSGPRQLQLQSNLAQIFRFRVYEHIGFSRPHATRIFRVLKWPSLQCSGLYLKCTLTTQKSPKHCPRSFRTPPWAFLWGSLLLPDRSSLTTLKKLW